LALAGDSCTILIIDDEPSIGRMVSYVLEELGCELVIAHDAESGLKLVESKEPHLVICDVRLPGMDGVEFAMLMKQNRPSVPVLLMSAYGMPAQHVGDGFIKKPFDNDELLRAVRRHLEQSPRMGAGPVYGSAWPLEIIFGDSGPESPLSE
jgi:CheY-like chemotaxis protein